MIFGVGVDIVKVCRLKKWAANRDLLERFFNNEEISGGKSIEHLCEHYAARFAAKEAFSKALGTGISGFLLRDVFIKTDGLGAPHLITKGTAKKALKDRCGDDANVYVSISHEKEYAIAFVVIEMRRIG